MIDPLGAFWIANEDQKKGARGAQGKLGKSSVEVAEGEETVKE